MALFALAFGECDTHALDLAGAAVVDDANRDLLHLQRAHQTPFEFRARSDLSMGQQVSG